VEKTAESKLRATFFYRKSNFFRVVHADGATGGPTPDRKIMIAIFNQRSALPDMVEHVLTPDGRLGPEVARQTEHEGFIREVEVGIVMEPNTAKELAEWLQRQVRLLESTPVEKTSDQERKTQ